MAAYCAGRPIAPPSPSPCRLLPNQLDEARLRFFHDHPAGENHPLLDELPQCHCALKLRASCVSSRRPCFTQLEHLLPRLKTFADCSCGPAPGTRKPRCIVNRHFLRRGPHPRDTSARHFCLEQTEYLQAEFLRQLDRREIGVAQCECPRCPGPPCRHICELMRRLEGVDEDTLYHWLGIWADILLKWDEGEHGGKVMPPAGSEMLEQETRVNVMACREGWGQNLWHPDDVRYPDAQMQLVRQQILFLGLVGRGGVT